MSAFSYSFRNLTAQHTDPQLRLLWQTLVDASNSAEALYQSPAFFDFLCATAHDGRSAHIYGLYQSDQQQPLGLILVQHQRADCGAARWQRREQLVVLGSAALLPQAPQQRIPSRQTSCNPGLLHAVHRFLLAEFRTVEAIVYRALPIDGPIWHALQQDCSELRPLHLHGWRDCHYMHLPSSYAAYLAQLAAKRRYNLKRQQRLLSEQAGAALQLLAIEGSAQLDLLQEALIACCPVAQRAQLWDKDELRALAQHGLLLCYRIDAGNSPCGVVLGLQMHGVYHLFNLLPAQRWQALSAGTTLLQLVLADLCDQRHFIRLEFGYGSPAHAHQSSNQLSRRSHLLLLRPHWRNQLYYLTRTLHNNLRQLASRYRQR